MPGPIKIFLKFGRFKDFARKIGLNPIYFIVPAFFFFIAASLEGISILLLLPLIKGIVQKDFAFVIEQPVLKNILLDILNIKAHQNTAIFLFLIIALLVTVVALNTIRYFAVIMLSYRLRNSADQLRRLIFKRYLSFGKLFFDQHNLGYLHNILMGYTQQITSQFNILQEAFNRFFTLIVYTVMIFIISFRLTIYVIILLPLFYWSAKWLVSKVERASRSYVAFYKEINEKIFNILSCIPLVKIYTTEKQEMERFSVLSDRLRAAEFNIDKKNKLISPFQDVTILIVILLLIAVVSFMVIKEKTIEVSHLLVYFLLLRRVSTNFNCFTTMKTAISAISGPISEIGKIFDEKDKFFVNGGPREFDGLKEKIEISNLSFSYAKEIQLLKNVTFSIEKGKITALVGPSGAGKTTIINLILRLYECPANSIFIDGIDIREFNLMSLRKHMAFVSQDILLFNDTVKNNMIYGLDRDVSTAELEIVAKKSWLYDYIMSLPDKFETSIGDRGIKLSGGEKQRLAIARALLKNAEILILDEATSSLDSTTEQFIQDAIREAVRGRTTIVIAHRFSTIKDVDKIVVLAGGKVVEEGRLSDLLARKGKFYEYWQAQKFY